MPIDAERHGAHRVAAAHARAARRAADGATCPSCAGASARSLSDEEFLLRATMPARAGGCDARGRARPRDTTTRRSKPGDEPAAHAARAPRPVGRESVEKPGFRLELRRARGTAA